MTISPLSSMIVMMHYLFLININCLPVIFLMEVGLDFTPRFISKEEDKDVQREVFSRHVKNPFRLEMSSYLLFYNPMSALRLYTYLIKWLAI